VEIRDKVALVTGSGSGIGRATALRLAREGAAVVVADIDEESGRETVRQIEATGGRAAFNRADVASEADVRAMIAFAEETFGGLDILVNNAGVVEGVTTERLSFPEVEPERWNRTLDVNLRGVILGTQYGIKEMRKRGGGVIVNISSGAGIGYGPHGSPVYAASKAGVMRFSAALEPLKDRMDIRVNCICPGWVDTPMVQRTRAERSPEEWQAIAPAVMLQPEEIADAVVELIRDDSLAGRVMLCYEGETRRLVPVETEA
jgi:NAD(P)-dependent dehydrogenase (short-subunit alcohol dehydrogenase family)